jgi:ABC-type multidrug transport system fused ATPase/permease subunit
VDVDHHFFFSTVVGRTGSGKSSLLNALLRVVEIDDDQQGEILIDGVNTHEMGLARVRRAMAIIPQDPILFTGTVRYNLDPLSECSDADLWRALELASLSNTIKALEGRLDYVVSAIACAQKYSCL